MTAVEVLARLKQRSSATLTGSPTITCPLSSGR
jgi:hypothetical protein